MPHLAQSVESVPHSRIRELAEIAMSMDGVLRLYFGESNLPTPEYIKRAAAQALADGYTFYTENAGLPSLRRAIAAYYRRLQGVDLDPMSEIVVTASGVQALNVAIRCLLDPGDEALVLAPVWPNGSSIVAMANAVVRQIPHPLCGDRYHVDFEALEAAVTPRTRLLLYTSPSNPLGWVATDEEQQRLLDFARRHGLWLVADEVYDRLYYAGPRLGCPVASILRKATREDAVAVVQSFSKSYCMTGWRLGWLVARRDLAAKATQLNEFIVSHAPSFAQKAGETALAEGEAELRAHDRAAQRESRSLPGGFERNAWRDRAHSGRSVLRIPAHRRSRAIRSRFANDCLRRPAWAWRRAWPSAREEKARCGSATRRSGPFWSRPWSDWGSSYAAGSVPADPPLIEYLTRNSCLFSIQTAFRSLSACRVGTDDSSTHRT